MGNQNLMKQDELSLVRRYNQLGEKLMDCSLDLSGGLGLYCFIQLAMAQDPGAPIAAVFTQLFCCGKAASLCFNAYDLGRSWIPIRHLAEGRQVPLWRWVKGQRLSGP